MVMHGTLVKVRAPTTWWRQITMMWLFVQTYGKFLRVSWNNLRLSWQRVWFLKQEKEKKARKEIPWYYDTLLIPQLWVLDQVMVVFEQTNSMMNKLKWNRRVCFVQLWLFIVRRDVRTVICLNKRRVNWQPVSINGAAGCLYWSAASVFTDCSSLKHQVHRGLHTQLSGGSGALRRGYKQLKLT